MSARLHKPLSSYTVRLSANGQSIGSGFLVDCGRLNELYVLTARHCLFNNDTKQPIESLAVDYYDPDQQRFIQTVQIEERFFFAQVSDDVYDVAILPISKHLESNDIPLIKCTSSNESGQKG